MKGEVIKSIVNRRRNRKKMLKRNREWKKQSLEAVCVCVLSMEKDKKMCF